MKTILCAEEKLISQRQNLDNFTDKVLKVAQNPIRMTLKSLIWSSSEERLLTVYMSGT